VTPTVWMTSVCFVRAQGEFDFQSAKIDVLKPYAKVIWVQYSLLGAVVLLNALIAIMVRH
jgi:hypothetical protein